MTTEQLFFSLNTLLLSPLAVVCVAGTVMLAKLVAELFKGAQRA